MNNPYYLKDSSGDYYNQYPEFQTWEEGKQAGIKEVVEWIMQPDNIVEVVGVCTKTYWLNDESLQPKLKEWGIEQEQHQRTIL